MTVKASVIVPTTGDRGLLLPFSVGSALAQTVDDIEVLIIGDGIDDHTRSVINELAASDPRVRFFDFPKHERRGEPNRHQVLINEARGEIVCYLTDRDLFLPDHIAEVQLLLADADLAHTLWVDVDGDEHFRNGGRGWDWRDPKDRGNHASPQAAVPLSMGAHTMDAYRRLPFGWRTTPEGTWTDHYMWQQFLVQPWVRVAVGPVPTVLYFNRGEHPGWSTERRLDLLERWAPRIATPEGVAELRREMAAAQWAEWAAHARKADDRYHRLWRRALRKAHRPPRRSVNRDES